MLKNSKRGGNTLSYLLGVVLALATSSAWARVSVDWRGGSGGTEESPLDIYNTSEYSSSVTEFGDNYNLTFDAGQTPTVLTNSAPTGTKIANLFNLKYGTWTMLGDYKFSSIDTLASGTNPKQTTIIKKGDWEMTYATYLGRSDMTAILTNVCGNIVHSGTSWFQIGNTGTAIVENLSGDWNIAGPFTVGASAQCELYWRGGNLTYTYTGRPLYLAYGGSSNALVEKYAGDWTISHYLCLSEGGSSSATFRHLGGTMKVNGTDIRLLDNRNNSTGGANFELGGGTVEAKLIKHGAGTAPAKLKFDGGTLKALAAGTLVAAHNNLDVDATSNGGTIDANGYAVTIEEVIENASGETGTMTFVGGGVVTLAAQPNYTGITTVEVGTTLVVPSAITRDKLVFTIPDGLVDGVYTVVSISANSQFADNVLSGKPDGFVLSSDKKKICYVKNIDTTKPIYIGTDGNLSTAGNWLDGTVPTGGNPVICCPTAATLTVGDTFSADTITIPEESAVVTIGAGTLHVNTLTNASKLAIGAGASLEVDGDIVAKPGGYGETAYFLYSNEGSVIVHGNAVGIGISSVNVYEYVTADANTKPMQVGGIRYEAGGNTLYFHINSANSYYNQGPGSWVIGSEGIGFTSGRENGVTHFFTQYGGSVMLHSSADWTLANSMKNKANQGDILVNGRGDITFDTSDYNSDLPVPRTITLEGRLYANNVGMDHSAFIIDGCGTVVVDTADMSSVTGIDEHLKHTCISNSILQVKSGATLKVNAGKKITGVNGRIALDDGATLTLVSSGTDDFISRIDPSLVLPATGAATIRIDGKRLSSGDHVVATVVSGTAANVVPDLSGTALDGRKASFRVDNGVLVLNIQSNGTMIVVR